MKAFPLVSGLTAGAFFLLLALTVALFWGEVITLSLLIAHVEVSVFPLMLLIDALRGAITGNIQVRLQAWFNSRNIMGAGLIGAIGLILPGKMLVEANPDAAYMLLFLAHRTVADTCREYAIPHLAAVYTLRHRREQVIRLIGAGRGTAAFCTLLLIPISQAITQADMVNLWLGSIGMVVILVAGWSRYIDNTATSRAQVEVEATSKTGWLNELRMVTRTGSIRWLVVSAVSMSLLMTLVFYQTLAIVEAHYTKTTTLITFFSLVRGVGTWLTLPASYWMFSRLLRQFNVGSLAVVYAWFLNLVFAGMLLLPAIPLAVLGDFTRSPIRHNIYEPLERLLHHALPEGAQVWLRRLFHRFIDPGGQLLASLILLLTLAVNDSADLLFMVGLPAGLFFLLATRQTGQIYETTLAVSLEAGRYHFLRQTAAEWEMIDQTHIRQLVERLQIGKLDEREHLLIAEVVAQSEEEAGYAALTALWATSSPEMQAELLPLIVNAWPDKYATNSQLVFQALDSNAVYLHRQALYLIAMYPELDPQFRVIRFLIDGDPEVSALAAAILLKHPGAQLRKAARAQLRWLAKHPRVGPRMLAVKMLVGDSLDAFGDLVAPLDVARYLQDSATRVRHEVLPAASIPQLVNAACDPSTSVRAAAAHHLRLRYFQGARRRLVEAIEQVRQLERTTSSIQIDAGLRYWRLLVALSRVERRAGYRRLSLALNKGIEYLTLLQQMSETVHQLQLPELRPLIRQLELDYTDLLNAMIEYLGILFGKARIQPIVWTLQTNQDTDQILTVLRTLQSLTTSAFAQQFVRAVRRDLVEATVHQSILPDVVFGILLAQVDAWRPLVTLHLLSRFPPGRRRAWLDPEAVSRVLEASARSSIDVIREAGRIIHKTLESDTKDETIQTEGAFMLSTLERMLFLRNVSFFQSLQFEQLRTLARGCEEVSALEGQRIISQGEIGEGLYIVVEGEVRVERRLPETREPLVIGRLGPSEVFGEISLLDGGLRTADVVANTSVLLLGIHRDALQAALEDDPTIALTMLKTMARRLRTTTDALEQNLALQASFATSTIDVDRQPPQVVGKPDLEEMI